MAYWGVAMTNFQPIWEAPTEEQLEAGQAAVEIAMDLGGGAEREDRYIATVEAFFADPDVEEGADAAAIYAERTRSWKESVRELHEAEPEDVDAAAFLGLAMLAYQERLVTPADDRDFEVEKQAGAMLEGYLDDHPEHPGLYHYIIHIYDFPQLAHKGVEVAHAYDDLAPHTPHALHMPSHIFVRLGEWEETVEWNIRSAEAALNHPVNGTTSIHYPHALDYKMYGYLQLGQHEEARETLEKVRAIDDVEVAFGSAYGIAAAQARYYLERGAWEGAAELEENSPAALDWDAFPGAQAIFHYARGLGAARTGELEQARAELEAIEGAVAALEEDADLYWKTMTEALAKAVEGWIAYAEGDVARALELMDEGAQLEESLEKHPTTPGEVLPVRELHGDLLLEEGRLEQAREAYETSLERTPNRRNPLERLEQVEEAQGTS